MFDSFIFIKPWLLADTSRNIEAGSVSEQFGEPFKIVCQICTRNVFGQISTRESLHKNSKTHEVENFKTCLSQKKAHFFRFLCSVFAHLKSYEHELMKQRENGEGPIWVFSSCWIGELISRLRKSPTSTNFETFLINAWYRKNRNFCKNPIRSRIDLFFSNNSVLKIENCDPELLYPAKSFENFHIKKDRVKHVKEVNLNLVWESKPWRSSLKFLCLWNRKSLELFNWISELFVFFCEY